MDTRPEAAEAIGVALLVFSGVSAAIAGGSALAVALAFAFTIVVLVYALGHVSGAHFNPAITLAFAATGHFPWRRVPTYVGAQVAGALAAALALRALHGDLADVGVTSSALPAWKVISIEAAATFLLALVIIGVATDRRAVAGASGLAIGLAVGVGAIAAGPFTGGSMNPARSIGPALASGALADAWLYVVGPALGAIAGMGVYEAIRGGDLGVERREARGALGPVPALAKEEPR